MEPRFQRSSGWTPYRGTIWARSHVAAGIVGATGDHGSVFANHVAGGYSRTCHGCDRGDTLGQIIPPSIVIVLLQGTLVICIPGAKPKDPFGLFDALTYLGSPAVLSVGTFNQQRCCLSILRLANLWQGRRAGWGGYGADGLVICWCSVMFLMNLGVVGSQSIIVDNY
jgi:hypothetical protein